MNSTFKVVFNKARGALMVVNEVTKSYQVGKKAAVAVALLGALASGSAFAVENYVLSSQTYDTINFPSNNVKVTTGVTAVSADGKWNSFNGEVKSGGTLVLASDNAEIQTVGDLWVSGKIVSNQEEGTLNNLNFDGGSITLYGSGASINVEGTFTYHNDGGYISGYLTVSNGSELKADKFVTTSYYSIKNSSTVTFREAEVAGMVRNLAGGTLNITEKATVGHLWNMGTVNASNAVIEIETAEDMLPTDYDGTTIFKFEDGKTYTFGNGIDREQGNADKVTSDVVMNVKTLIVNGNALNSDNAELSVNNITVTEVFNNQSGATLAVSNGRAVFNTVSGKEDSAITLSHSSMSADNASTFGVVNANDSDITLGNGDYTFATLAGENAVLNMTKAGSTATIESNTATLSVLGTGEVNDDVGGINGFVGGDAPALSVGRNTGSVKVSLEEGLVEGAATAELDAEGKVKEGTVVEKINSVQDATLDLTVSLPLTITRALTNDVRKRLGDIRSAQGTHGVWARYDGGKMSDDSGEFDHKFNTVQIGIDTVPTPDSARFGVAFSYTQGDTDFGRGSSDMDAFSLAAYGTWIADNGLFADVIGRIATVKNDMTVGQYKGKTDNTVLSLSGELGWRYDVTSMFYVEPQAELTYTYIDGDKFKLGYADYETDSADSLVGRAGFALGIKCPNNKGDAYVRVSAVHEFLGDSMVTARAGNTINTAEFDGKDTWVEYGIGASYNVTPNTYIWADIERTSGAVVDEDVRGTVGVRFSF